MKENIIICSMGSEDIDAVREIEKICFSVPWSREAFRMEVEENRCARYIVAKVQGHIVGYGGMWLIIDESHITNIAVHPDYRGMGIGEAIMRELMRMAYAFDVHRMTLEVRKSNRVAQSLYHKLGFEACGVRKKYYSDNKEDALIMWNENIDDQTGIPGA